MKIGFQKVFGVLLVISLCIGFIGISIIGSIVFPKVNKVAYPVVCANGTVQINSQTHNNYNGGTTTDTSIYCVNNTTATQTDITYSSDLVGGTFYTLAILVPLLVIYGIIHMINKLRSPSS